MVTQFFALGAAAGAAAERYGLPLPSASTVRGALKPNDANIDAQALSLAKTALINEEGRRNDVYLDSRGYATVGIGHLVLPQDNLKLGDRISNAQVEAFFAKDIATAFAAARTQAKEIDKYNPEMIARLTSVNFQLGTGWRTKFPNTWSLIKNGKIDAAIRNLLASKWYQQTPNRVIAFINTLNNQYA